MNIMYTFIVSFTLIVTLTCIGIWTLKKNWKLALLFVIPVILILSISNFIYNLIYTTTPDSLELQAILNNQQIMINWEWKNKFEEYSYGKDYVAVSLPESIRISDTNMTVFEISKEEDRYLLSELREVLEKNPNYDSSKELYLFEVKLQKNFQAFIETIPEISINNIVIQYIHVYYPPMDSFKYWVKTFNGIN